MSLNLTVHANIHVEVPFKDGKVRHSVATEEFRVWQTPTDVTFSILGKPTHNEKVKAYKTWVLSLRDPGDDLVCDHLKAFDEWLADHDGWEIEFSYI